MGKIKQGILGGFSGKVGTVVGGAWKGIDYMRSLATSVSNPKTSAQMAVRTNFSTIARIMSKANLLLKESNWRQAKKQSAFNAGVRINYKNAVVDGVIDMERLVFGEFSLSELTGLEAEFVPDGTDLILNATWTNDANDETSQFLGDIFRNAPVISFGDNAIGLKAVYETDSIDIAAQYLNVENTVEIGPDEEVNNDDITRHGFVSAQVNFKPGFIEDMEGNYRVYVWGLLDGGVKWEDGKNTTDYGFGVSIDQQLSDIFGVFARYSWKRDDAVSSTIGAFEGDIESPCNQTWSIGAQAKIKALGDEDIVGLAFGQMMISDKAKDAYEYDFKAEDHLEVYYSWNISDYLAVTPSIQYVNNICGGASEDFGTDNSAFVGSVRMQISF